MKAYLSFNRLLPLAIIIIAMSCGPSLKVNTDYDKSVNFTSYKTFSLYKADEIHDAISELNKDRIANAIRAEMIKRGFQENTTSPDLLVNPVAIFKDRTSVSSTTNYYGYGGMYRPYYGGGGMVSGTTSYDVQHYKDGSLIIDVLDASTKKLIWQGVGNKEIDGPVKDPDTNIPKAVAAIMADFPPGSKKK
ncbi:MAG: DUF4136 domain-containing protein [Bacteroidetes bacterium]|jgi:hypothetical protein|nr:MAG: DUF4136 domain-containing protein [Bacteroidota bacterium]